MGDGDLDLTGGDLDLDLEELLLDLLLDREVLLLLGLLDRDLLSLCGGGEGDLLVYRLLGGEGLFSIGTNTGLGLLDFCLSPIAICSSFSFLA